MFVAVFLLCSHGTCLVGALFCCCFCFKLFERLGVGSDRTGPSSSACSVGVHMAVHGQLQFAVAVQLCVSVASVCWRGDEARRRLRACVCVRHWPAATATATESSRSDPMDSHRTEAARHCTCTCTCTCAFGSVRFGRSSAHRRHGATRSGRANTNSSGQLQRHATPSSLSPAISEPTTTRPDRATTRSKQSSTYSPTR